MLIFLSQCLLENNECLLENNDPLSSFRSSRIGDAFSLDEAVEWQKRTQHNAVASIGESVA